jgi:16S rRNA (guanine527-N7)-methyltransferase
VTLDETLAAYAEAVRRSPHNLVSPRAREELESRHIPESVALARMLPEASTLVDIGSGGGLPGLVIAAVRPDLAVTLVEATRKKARFLRTTARALGLDVEVVEHRIEDVAHDLGPFDLATARAVAPRVRLVAWAMPGRGPGGGRFAG